MQNDNKKNKILISYINSQRLRNECNKVGVIKDRAEYVEALIDSYALLNHMNVVEPELCSLDDLQLFHSSHYVEYLKRNDFRTDEENNTEISDNDLEYGLGYDCPILDNIYKFTRVIAGATLKAVEEIIAGRAEIAINWCGGWHHAQRDEAEGFCYVNDIAIGIQKLREKFHRILYIDLDIHHGDGVENAFSTTKKVMTVSFHLLEPGYFPGTGNSDECGFGQAKGYAVNAPFKRNITGELYIKYFKQIITMVKDKYKPEVVITQCGADVITGDKLGGSNLIPSDLGECIKFILNWKIPMIFLGGGGYHNTNTSRYWTYLTSIICGQNIDIDLPDNKYFLSYGPDYMLSVDRKNLRDYNDEASLMINVRKITENLNQYNVNHNS